MPVRAIIKTKYLATALFAMTLLGGAAQAAGIGMVKVCNSGDRAGKGVCPAEPVLGNQPQDWACTWDTNTGLMWQVALDDGGPLDKDRRFTRLERKEPGYGTPSDAAGFVAEVKALQQCGSKKWRMPTVSELLTIVNRDFRPTIDPAWFPNTFAQDYWTADLYRDAGTGQAYTVMFADGAPDSLWRTMAVYVRLVAAKPYRP